MPTDIPITFYERAIIFVLKQNAVIKFLKLHWLKYFSSNFNVGISIKKDSGKLSDAYHETIKEKLSEIVDKFNLSSEIRISFFSDIKTFKNKKEAIKFRKENDLDLLVWGNFSSESLKLDGETVIEPTLKFTFKYPDNKDGRIGKSFGRELKSVLKSKKINLIKESSSLTDLKILPEKVFDICSYIVGVSSLLYGKIDASEKILESLLKRNKNDQTNFIKGVRAHLNNIYTYRIKTLILEKENYKNLLSVSEKMTSLNPSSISGLTAKAIAQFNSGEIKESEKTVALVQNKYPSEDVTNINVAFFRILQKKYNRALKYYKKLLRKKELDGGINPLQVVEFLEDQYDLNKNEKAYLFASGLINFKFADLKRGKELLKQFIRSSKNIEHYKTMRRCAKKLIDNG
ncbi:MAG: hypothetical protein ABFQ62_02395 [Patescibacteria group bacterium]